MNLQELSLSWIDSEKHALFLRDYCQGRVESDTQLLEHRTYIEKHAYGMGERCFHWLWKLIIDTMPRQFSFLEVGVYKGQVLSLARLLAGRTGRKASITGVTMLSDFSGPTGKFSKYPDEDYAKYIKDLHDRFGLEQPRLIVGDSTSPDVQAQAQGEYDIIYIDGCHEYDYVVKDLTFYGGLVKRGGLLVVDDCSNHLRQPFGFFQGIQDVSSAVAAVLETSYDWDHKIALVHNRVWRRQ